jgi:hypothetical protein
MGTIGSSDSSIKLCGRFRMTALFVDTWRVSDCTIFYNDSIRSSCLCDAKLRWASLKLTSCMSREKRHGSQAAGGIKQQEESNSRRGPPYVAAQQNLAPEVTHPSLNVYVYNAHHRWSALIAAQSAGNLYTSVNTRHRLCVALAAGTSVRASSGTPPCLGSGRPTGPGAVDSRTRRLGGGRRAVHCGSRSLVRSDVT